jgi:class 3 adenylate cyclase/Tfp pilus assembly protein PilF
MDVIGKARHLIWVLACIPLMLSAQEEIKKKGSDPLQGLVQTDSAEVDTLLKRSNELRYANPDSSILLSRRAVELSDGINYETGKAFGFKNIGIVYYDKGDYEEALAFFTRSLRIFEKERDTFGISNLQNNIGSVYRSVGDYPKALDYFLNSLRNGEVVQDSLRIGTAYVNIGTAYSEDVETYPQAIENYQKSIEIFEQMNFSDGIAYATLNFGEWYLNNEQPAEAIPYLEKALKVFNDLQVDPSPVLNFLGKANLELEQYDQAQKLHEEALVAAQQDEDISEESKAYLGLGNTYLSTNRYTQAVDNFMKGLELAEQTGVLKDKMDGYEGLAKSYSAIQDYGNAFTAQQNFALMQDSIRSEGYERMMSQMNAQYGLESAQKENELLKAENELAELQIEKDARAKQLFQIIIGLFLAIIAGFVFQYFYIRRTNKRLAFERNRSEQILLNILPKEVADELKEKGYTDAKEFDNITVLFTDFKAFSLIAERISAERLVKSVDYYFKNFDEITERHNLEKIKTIGDAYMCAGGIPTANDTHIRDAFGAAREILKFVNDTELNPPPGVYPFKIRIGLNAGPVVAGVVGTKKFAYDIWGNTVNIAARMESGSVPGRINVSEKIYEELKEEHEFSYRGELKVKNQVFKMYFADVPETIFA